MNFIDMPFIYRVDGLRARARRPEVVFAVSSTPVRVDAYEAGDVEFLGRLRKRVCGYDRWTTTEYAILPDGTFVRELTGNGEQIGGRTLNGVWGENFRAENSSPGMEYLNSIVTFFQNTLLDPQQKRRPFHPSPLLPWTHVDDRSYGRPEHVPIVREEDLREIQQSTRDEIISQIRKKSRGLCMIRDRVFVPTAGPAIYVEYVVRGFYVKDVRNMAVCDNKDISIIMPATTPRAYLEEIRTYTNNLFALPVIGLPHNPDWNLNEGYEGRLPTTTLDECLRLLGNRIVRQGWKCAPLIRDADMMKEIIGLSAIVDADEFDKNAFAAALEVLQDRHVEIDTTLRMMHKHGSTWELEIGMLAANVEMTRMIVETAQQHLPEFQNAQDRAIVP
jgi:hypothetical protein